MNHNRERNTILNLWLINSLLPMFYCLMPYNFVCAMGFIIHHFFHRFHGHLQNIFCTHLTQAPYDAINGNSPLQDTSLSTLHDWLVPSYTQKCKQYISLPLARWRQ